jgi:hypothetical protein
MKLRRVPRLTPVERSLLGGLMWVEQDVFPLDHEHILLELREAGFVDCWRDNGNVLAAITPTGWEAARVC